MVLVWYVIQVINGREDVMRERIERMVPEGAMQELFYPQYQTEIKVHGECLQPCPPKEPNAESLEAIREGDAFFASGELGRFDNSADLINAALNAPEM